MKVTQGEVSIFLHFCGVWKQLAWKRILVRELPSLKEVVETWSLEEKSSLEEINGLERGFLAKKFIPTWMAWMGCVVRLWNQSKDLWVELEGMGKAFGNKSCGLEKWKVTRRELKVVAVQKNTCSCWEGRWGGSRVELEEMAREGVVGGAVLLGVVEDWGSVSFAVF